jgi:hypothetical protein
MLDWIVNDCGDHIEIRHIVCGSKTDYPYLDKKSFLDSHFVRSEEGYFRKDALVLSTKEYPSCVKDVLDRVHISGNLERMATELTKKRSRAQTATGRLLLYLMLILACVGIFGYTIRSAPYYTLGVFAVLILVLAMSGRFQRKYAPWRISLNEKLFIRLWNAVKNLQSFVNSGGSDDSSFAEGYRLLDVSGYGISVASSWGLVKNAQWQMWRTLRNIMRGIRPFVKSEKHNARQIERLVIPMLEGLLPLLVNSDSYSIDTWNNMAEQNWPQPNGIAFSMNKLRAVFARRWVRLMVASISAIVVFVAGSPIAGVPLAAYVQQNYQFFWIILIGFLGLVLAPDLIQREEKTRPD